MKRRFLCVTLSWLLGVSGSGAFDASSLGELGLGLGGIAYWSHPVFANDMWNGSQWLEFATGQWGNPVFLENNPQFDTNGFPMYLNPGMKLRAIVFSLHANPTPRPSTWPDRTGLARGKIVITWQGDADIRADGGTYLAGESSGGSTGRLVNGRRVYRYTGTSYLQWITIEDLNAANPIRDLKIWLPDPADPANATLEGQLFHPWYLARLAEAPWSFLRFMDWNASNASPQQDWADRRPPRHVFMDGVLNRRAPANGSPGDRGTGVAFEHMVALCNAADHDMWINIPHLATDVFVIRLAQLIRFGSDGVNPYTNEVASPVYPPLAAGRRVYVEYSNEIWSGGYSFPQGNWAQDQATVLGITKEQFNARRFCQVWRLFQSVFAGQSDRVVRVAAVWTGMQFYTQNFLNEIAAYGPTLAPPQTPDVIAPTTYFGNGIQDWAYEKGRQQAGTTDQWFFTTALYTNGTSVRPVSMAATAPYWTGTNVARHVAQTFAEWKRRLLSESSQSGGGPDATGVGGGFEFGLRQAITSAFGAMKPLAAYEGGPSIYTDYLDSGDSRDAGITTFLELLNRQSEFANVYRIHLNLAKAKGLRTHSAFVDVSAWGRYGQWGHLEYGGQNPTNSVKWTFLRNWPAEMAGLRPIDNPLGNVPVFATPAKLPTSFHGQPYAQELAVTNGDGGLALEVVDSLLMPGLSISNAGSKLLVSGTPASAGVSYLLARVRDADGDPAWRTFWLRTTGGPGTLLECNFDGTNPAKNLPWTQRLVLKNGVTFSGWTAASGVVTATGNDALTWSQNMPADEASSTLGLALTNGAYWRFTLTGAKPLNLRGAQIQFTIRRIDYHAPRRYALFTSVGGFDLGAQVFDTGYFTDTTDRDFTCALPDAAAYSNLVGAVEFRLMGYSGQYAGHKTSLRAFKVIQAPAGFDLWLLNYPSLDPSDSLRSADPDHDGINNLLEYAFALNPTTPSVSGTYGSRVRISDEDFLQITYRERTGGSGTVGVDYAVAGLTYAVQLSPDLNPAGWTTNPLLLDQVGAATPNGDGTETVSVRLNTPMRLTGPQYFMRLNVTEQ